MVLAEQTQVETITLTPAAADAVRDLMEKRELEGYGLRVYIQGGGCSGYQYGMALDDNFRDEDLVLDCHGVKVVVDEVSIDYMRGSTVDFVDDLMGRILTATIEDQLQVQALFVIPIFFGIILEIHQERFGVFRCHFLWRFLIYLL